MASILEQGCQVCAWVRKSCWEKSYRDKYIQTTVPIHKKFEDECSRDGLQIFQQMWFQFLAPTEQITMGHNSSSREI